MANGKNADAVALLADIDKPAELRDRLANA